ncbi:bifunctional adenosylcobinamide kinase/adenosylcobinamide-phosphate guanylyltransferase [Halomonas sp. DWK9]|uniref:bifunctional adenosylcobinamide kinase/adenosylcobinamide-phosphate guanylyltransferase n=1 Tax=Halomonas sp. DWK9 TaxID=3060155 RepID=UPI00287F7A5A|nr:bifunctional adenosylcobinamide kinase/adenosylcobinamide-phosphate guanylyltransferase [Halomonas sp. DWK9]
MIVFVSGGARSGKSHIAEQCILHAANGHPCYYVATASVYDDEMAERVARHQADRAVQWVTLEAPLAIDQAIDQVPSGHAVLLDCLTLWVSQVMFHDGEEEAPPLTNTEALALLGRCVNDARHRNLTLVVVSNDINEAPLPRDPDTWRYLEWLQGFHRWLAVRADSVIEVVAGQPMEWKEDADT